MDGHFTMSQQRQQNLSGSWESRWLRRDDINSHLTLCYNTVTADLINLENQIIIQRGEQGSGKHLLWTHKLSGGPGDLCIIKMISIETEKLWWTRHHTRARYTKLNEKQSPRQIRETNRQKNNCIAMWYMLWGGNVIHEMSWNQRRKFLGVVEETSYKRGQFTCVSKDNL